MVSPGSPHRARHWRAVTAASIGNAFEWFDFVLYGYFAATIAKLFFPTGSETASLLLALASFGVTFVTRPFGAVVLGNLADRRGRKKVLTLTMWIMTAGTAITALAPTYSSVGILAPIMITGARLLQGFSAGGEFGSATVFLAEQDPNRRGFYASLQFASQGLSGVLATSFGAVLTSVLTSEQMEAWGWRIPFLFGLLIMPAGYYIRLHLDESWEFRSTQTASAPLRETFAHAKTRLLVASGTVILGTVATYTAVYIPAYAVRELGLPPAGGFLAVLFAGAIQVVVAPASGALSDKFGRLPIAAAMIVVLLITLQPLFARLVTMPTIGWLLFVQGLLGICVSAYAGPIPALICQLFPTRVRATAVSTSYSLAVAIFGGSTPFINASLINITGSNLVPAYYLMFAAAISFLALGAARRLGCR